jgi:hypothetical protein
MKHNRTAEAAVLLQEIVDWCARTDTPETSIGHVLFLHPGFVGLMRLRLTVSEDKEAAVRQFMADHPNGWRGDLPVTHGNGTKPRREKVPATRLTDEEIVSRRVDRSACPHCGVRSDVGCKHIGAGASR